MRSMRRRGVRRAGSFLLALLLLVPLTLRGHRHDADRAAASRPCATCVATLHSPAVNPAGPALASPVFQTLALAAAPAPPARRPERRQQSGRAPPAALGVHSA